MLQTLQARRAATWLLIALAIIALNAPGCAGRKARRAARAEKKAQARQTQPAQSTPLPAVAANARERALAELERAVRDSNPAVRANAIEALSLAPARAEAAVAAGLRDPNEGVRSVAAMVVGRTRLASQTAAVRPLLNDKSPYPRASAIYALSRNGAAVDPTPLGSMLMTDPSTRVRSHAVFILGELGEESALPMIRQAAGTPIPRASEVERRLFQLQAAEAMVKLGDDARLEPILAALFPASPEDLEATALAAQILGQLNHRAVVADLSNIAMGTYSGNQKMPAEVRLAAASSLAKLGRTERVAAVADEFIRSEARVLRAQAAMVFGDLRNPADIPKLEPMLSDESGLVRVSAAAAILKIAGPGGQGM